MKKLRLIFFLIYLVFNCKYSSAQAPNWLWVKNAAGNGFDYGRDITTDALGNIYVVGKSSSTSITFGSTTFTSTVPSAYLVKYDPSGNIIWVKHVGPPGASNGTSVATDTNNNVFMTGDFYPPSIVFGNYTLTCNGLNDVFIVKYDSNGNVLWANSAGGNGSEYSNGIATDFSGNVCITGWFDSPLLAFGSTTLMASSEDIFVTKYDANGNVLWAKAAGGSNAEYGSSVSIDSNNDIYISGTFDSPNLIFGTTTLTCLGGEDSYFTKYDSNGSIIWAKKIGGLGNDWIDNTAVDAGGNLCLVGTFSSNTLTIGASTFTNSGAFDGFVVKYDGSGNALWAKKTGGNSTDRVYSICSDLSSNLYITGSFASSSFAIGSTTLTSSSSTELFEAQFDPSGNAIWAKAATGTDADEGFGIATDVAGNVYTTGYYRSPTINFGSMSCSNSGTTNIYIAKSGSTMGNNEIRQLENILFSPNPFSDQTILKSKKYYKNATLTLFNSLGQIASEINNIEGNTITVSRNNLLEGVYFALLSEENIIISRTKIIISNK